MSDGRRLQPIPRSESLRLLSSVSMGRVVFTHRALPAIRPVNHLVDGGQIVIRVDRESALARTVGPDGRVVVAYEADMIDPIDHLGWSVIVVGRASLLGDGSAGAHYRRVLEPWVAGTFDHIITITAEIVDGFRLIRNVPQGDTGQPSEAATPPA